MSVFKSYLRQLIRQLKALKKAEEEGNKEEIRRIIDELLKDAQDGLEDDQEAIHITVREQIKAACDVAGISTTELGAKMGMSQQSMSARLKTGKFSKSEYEQMAKILGARFVFRFEFPDGTRI